MAQIMSLKSRLRSVLSCLSFLSRNGNSNCGSRSLRILFGPSEGSGKTTGSGSEGVTGRSIDAAKGSRGSKAISGKIADIEDSSISRSSCHVCRVIGHRDVSS